MGRKRQKKNKQKAAEVEQAAAVVQNGEDTGEKPEDEKDSEVIQDARILEAIEERKRIQEQIRQQALLLFPPNEKATVSDLVESMLTAGYHRARNTTLSDYDKIIGGLFWAVSKFDSKTTNIIFSEDCANMFKKTLPQKKVEAEQLISMKKKIKCRADIAVNDIINLNAPVLSSLVDWILPKLYTACSDPKRYPEFVAYFKNDNYANEQAAAFAFIKVLRRPNELMCSSMDAWNFFDFGILRDDFATGKEVMAEYMYYSRYGRKLYYRFQPGPEEGGNRNQDDLIPDEAYNKKRRELSEFSNKLLKTLEYKESKENVMQMYAEIEEIDIGNELVDLERAFTEEGKRYYKTYLEYSKLQVHYAKIQKYDRECITIDCDKLSEVVKLTIDKCDRLIESLEKDYVKYQRREIKYTSLVDDKGRIIPYSSARRDKADRLTEKRVNTDIRLKECKILVEELRKAWVSYEKISSLRKKTDPALTPTPIRRRFPNVDESLSDRCSILTARIRSAIRKIKSLPAPKEKGDADSRNAFFAYTTDTESLMSDWYWKARFMKNEHLEINYKLADLQVDTKLIKHAAHFNWLERKDLKVLNTAVRKVFRHFINWEAESETLKTCVMDPLGWAPTYGLSPEKHISSLADMYEVSAEDFAGDKNDKNDKTDKKEKSEKK